MNNSTTPRRWAMAVAMFVCIVVAQSAYGQCGDFVTEPGPGTVNMTLNLTAMNGTTVDLNSTVMLAYGFAIDPACAYEISPVSDFSSGVVSLPYTFDCSDVGAAQTWFIRVNGPAGPSTNNGNFRQLSITINDNILPLIGDIGNPPPFANDAGFCSYSGGVPGAAMLPAVWPAVPAPGQYDDNCAANLFYTLTGATTGSGGGDVSSLTFNVGMTTVTYTVTDNDGNSTSDQFTITVVDAEPPTVSCFGYPTPPTQDPGLIFGTSSNGVGDCATTVFTVGGFPFADNCPGAVASWSMTGATTASGSGNSWNENFNLGITVIEHKATDAVGATATCSFQVTIVDDEVPLINCPTSPQVRDLNAPDDIPACVYVAGDLSASEFDHIGASDNCDVSPTIYWQTTGALVTGPNFGSIDGTQFPIGNTTVTWYAEDNVPNTGSCSFVVTVLDTDAPINTPGNQTITVNVTPGDCSSTVSWEYPGIAVLSFLGTLPDDCSLYGLSEGPAIVNGVVDVNFLVPLTPFDPNCGRFNFICGTGATLQFPVGTTKIPYSWTDIYGNVTSDTVFVIVNEPEAPTALCKLPGAVVLSLDANGQATLLASQVDNGSSDNCGAVVLSVAPNTFTCVNVGSNPVVLTVNDNSPLSPSSTCNTAVTVVDNMPPVVNCPTSLVISAGANCETNASAIPGLAMAMQPNGSALSGAGQYQDNCGVTTINYLLTGSNFTGPASGAYPVPNTVNFKKGLTPVTYTFIDAAGNSSACSFNVNVQDLLAPTTANCPAPAPVNANTGGCIALVNWTPPTFTDNCPGAVLVTTSHNPGSFFFFGTTQVTYTAVDAAGNVGTCTFNVVVNDIQAPVANCKNITVALNSGGTVTVGPTQVDNNSTDNCFFNFTSPSATYTCVNMGANTYTLTVTDGGGLTSTCNATVTVVDNLAPSITNCGSFTPAQVNLDANCSGTLNAAVYAGNFTITDNTLNSIPSCSLTYEVDVDGSGFASSYTWNCADVGNNIVTFRVKDVFGNSSVCVKTIIVNDVTAPIINNANAIAPPFITIECDDYDPLDFGVLGQITLADVTDACDDACDDDLVIGHSDGFSFGSCDNEFFITRTWTVTDRAGNVTNHVQVFTIVDTEAPTFSGVQTLINLESNNQNETPPCAIPHTVEIFAFNVSDNCTGNFNDFTIGYIVNFPVGSISGSGASVTTNFPIGTSTVTFTVTDPCGNASQIAISVVVEDVDGPVINEPFGKLFGNTQKVCDSTFTILNATGNCGNNFTWYRPYDLGLDFLDCLPHSVTESISDPTVQSAINASSPFDYTNPPFFSIHPTTFFPVGETVITYTATDAVNNTTVCSFTVKVVDTQAPDVTCPPNQNLSIASGCVGVTVVPNYLNGVQVTDNCPNNVTLTQTPPAGTLLSTIVDTVKAGKVFTVKIKATDNQANNLSDSCTFTVTLFDGTAPVPDVPILPVITSFCGKDTVEAPSATDCDGSMFITIYGTPSVPVMGILPPFMPGGPPRYILSAGNYAITWSYTDPQNNTTTQLQSVQIFVDVFPPTANCKPPFAVNLSAAGDYALSISELDNGSFDQHGCGPITLSLNPAVLTCSNLNTPANVSLIVKDVNNNIAQCVTQVTVSDITAPVLSPIPANDTLEACAAIPAPANITAVDVCDTNVDITYKQDTITFVNAYKYTIRRTWKATDDSGNASTGTQIIVIQDTQAPVFAGNTPTTITVFTDLNNLDCKDTVAINIAPFVDDCDSTTFTITNNRTGQGANYSEILNEGTYTLIFTAKDGNNNISTHTITLIVKDGTNPIAACINGVSVSLQSSGNVTVTSANINASSSDNCTPQHLLDLQIQRLDPLGSITTSITFNCSDADGVTQHPVKLYVKDLAGNQSTCETYIIVQDNVFPQITSCPENKTLQCTADFSPAANGTPTATDNCTVSSIVNSDTIVDGTGSTCYQIVRTWQVFDQANNLTTCVQVLNIQDTVAPVLSSYAPDDTVSCSQGLPSPALVTATDNCTQNMVVTLQEDTIDIAQGPCGVFSFTVVRTRTAVDDCGNTEVHTRKIKVVDNEKPLFLGMPDTITIKSADYPPNLNCTVPVALNIGQYLTDCQPDSFINVVNNAPHGNGGLDISGNYSVGTYVVKFTATDACGNANSDSIVVMVLDNSIPTVICNDNVVISLGTNGEATIQPDDIDLGTTDNCDIDTMILSQSTFDCQDLGLNEVNLTVIDVNGNSNFCTVDVNVMLGQNAGFSLTTTGTPESYFGADNGTATATATGGSGQFSYTWSNGATTAAINGLAAGTYTITVIDTISGCLQVDTAMVGEGAKITLNVGTAEGCTGQTVSVAVTVDNFINVTGFQFTLHPGADSVGTILGVTSGSINPAIAAELDANLLAGNNLGIFWFDTSLTLPNGTVLFSVDIQLGTVAVGSITPILVTSNPVSLQFTQDSSGTPVVTGMVNIVNGEVEITCGVPDLEIGGDIQTWKIPTLPVPGVQVSLTGGVTANQTTGAPGTYLFGIPDNTNTTVECDKVTAGNDGLTGADVLLIKRHVLNIQLLASPYQYVAADVSGEGALSLIDYARIQQVALGLQQHITNSPDWKFVPKSYVFPTPNPLSVPFPETISHTPANTDFLDDDFVAVRMGDVNGSITPSFTTDNVDDRFGAFRFRLEDRSFAVGEVIEVPFTAADFLDRSGYQMTLHFDPKVFELEGILPGVLPDMSDANFGTMRLNDGMLTTLWVTAEPMTIADGETLFTLKFKVLRGGSSLAEVLRPGSDITRAEGYDHDGNPLKLDFEFTKGQNGVENATFALYQNQPNPFNELTTISFRLPETGRAALRVFNASGQLVKTIVGSFEKGYNELSFRRDEFGAPGVYYYELETTGHSDRKKMILID